MDFFKDVWDQGRRAAVDVLHGSSIDHSSPHSPDVPEDLRQTMPDLYDRFPIVMPWEKAQPIDPALHNVWLLDNTAFRTPQPGDHRPDLAELQDHNVSQPKRLNEAGEANQPTRAGSGWELEFVACYFIKNSGKDISKIVADIAHKLNVREDDDATRKRIAQRVEPFADTILPNRTLRITLDNKEQQTLGPSSHSGISAGLYQLHFNPPPAGDTNPTFQSSPVNLPPPFGMPSTTVVAGETGWGVISDIDDTIKVTQTSSVLGILRNTFTVETPQPISGMPELYEHMSSTLSRPPFFYLSASPYNLYPFLRRFREAHYPHGTIILRDASWQNLGGLIASMNENTRDYKIDRMVKIHAWFPHRRFVCFGDSTQSDPEAYGELARRFPGWIRAVFIHKVTGIAELDEKNKNAPQRFEKAFQGLERRLWHVYTDPGELTERLDALSKNPGALVGGE